MGPITLKFHVIDVFLLAFEKAIEAQYRNISCFAGVTSELG